ncbi:MAG TPA: hypothetical protein VFR02_06415, partial [bacterium]|nr:hypothetical protein [bacterium]
MGKPLWLLLVLAVGTLGPAWGGEPFSIPLYDPVSGRDLPGPGASTPTPTPTVTASQPVPAVTPVPTPVSPGTQPLLRAPDWTEVKTAPGNLHPLGKKSPWMSLLGLGADIPLGTGMARGYAVGFDLDLGTGYRLDDDWSLWANASLGQFSSRDDGLTRHNNFMMIEGAVWAKYRFSRG